MCRTHGFVEQRMTRNFRNYRPAHFDSTDHRFAMGGWNGTCVRLLPFSIPPQAVGPLCPPLHRRCKTLNSKLYASLRAPKTIRASYPIFPCHPPQQNLLPVSTEFSYPEGVELLIGQGWREATTLSNRRMGRI